MTGSSFRYREIFPGQTVLVFVPHEDDEINVAGAAIYGLRQEGFRVICVFATNGDGGYLAETRLSEAMASLRTLGVQEDDAVFLGYPDGGLDAARCVFLHGREAPLFVDGRSETYGIEGKPDFSMAFSGRHRPYTWEGFLADLRDVLTHYRPDGIIAVDFDSHPDHRMCSMALETVLGEILNEGKGAWQPRVLKAFAYNTGFESVKDFYADNLLSTAFNRGKIMDPALETDSPSYEWDRRLRLPVPEACRAPLLWENVLFHACRAHLSQWAMHKAEQIINGDEVFWLRRTDSLIYEGTVTVSSGDGRHLHDFLLLDTRDIRPKHGVAFTDCLWMPEESDEEKTCRCTFDEPRHIEAVSLYGDPSDASRILQGRLRFSTGYACDVGPLKPWGRETAVDIPPQEGVTWVEFQILEAEGEAGLSEWEIFGQKALPCRLLHILADGHFAYDWRVPAGQPGPEISAYTFGIQEAVRWYWDGESAELADIRAQCAAGITGPHTIRAEAEGLVCEARLLPESGWQRKKRAAAVWKDRLHSWWYTQTHKRAHHHLRVLKRKARRRVK